MPSLSKISKLLTFALKGHDEIAFIDGLLLVPREGHLGAARGARLLVLLRQLLVHVQQKAGRRAVQRRRARTPRPLPETQQLQDLNLDHFPLVPRHRVMYYSLVDPVVDVQSG